MVSQHSLSLIDAVEALLGISRQPSKPVCSCKHSTHHKNTRVMLRSIEVRFSSACTRRRSWHQGCMKAYLTPPRDLNVVISLNEIPQYFRFRGCSSSGQPCSIVEGFPTTPAGAWSSCMLAIIVSGIPSTTCFHNVGITTYCCNSRTHECVSDERARYWQRNSVGRLRREITPTIATWFDLCG